MGGFTLNNVTTASDYTEDNTVRFVSLENFTLTVTGAAIVYQLGRGGNFNTPEITLPPGFHTRHRPRYDSLRVRDALAGAHAQVTLETGR